MTNILRILLPALLLCACAYNPNDRFFDGKRYTLYHMRLQSNPPEGEYVYGRQSGNLLLVRHTAPEHAQNDAAFFKAEQEKLQRAGCRIEQAQHRMQTYYFCDAANAGTKEYRFILMILNQHQDHAAYSKFLYLADRPSPEKQHELAGKLAAFRP